MWNSGAGGPLHTLRDRPTIHKGHESTSASFSSSVEIQFGRTQKIFDYTLPIYKHLLPWRFFLVLQTTCIYFSFPTFQYRYCIIDFRCSAHKNGMNIKLNRQISFLFCKSDKHYEHYHVHYRLRRHASGKTLEGTDVMPTHVFPHQSLAVSTQSIRTDCKKQ